MHKLQQLRAELQAKIDNAAAHAITGGLRGETPQNTAENYAGQCGYCKGLADTIQRITELIQEAGNPQQQ